MELAVRFQSKSSINYMFRNFGQLFFVTLPVSVLLAIFAAPTAETDVFVKLVSGQLDTENFFNQFVNAFTVLRFTSSWWLPLLVAVVVVLLAYTMSLLVVKIDRHMRIGEMQPLPLKRAFVIFPMMLLYIFCWLAICELFVLIVVGVAYMLRFLSNPYVIVGIGFGLDVLANGILTYIFCLLIITFPLKFSENYRFNVAMSYSARVMTSKRGKLLAFTFAFPLIRCVVMALAYLARPLDVVIYTVGYFFLLTFIPCFAFKQYYDDVGGERRDISQLIFG